MLEISFLGGGYDKRAQRKAALAASQEPLLCLGCPAAAVEEDIRSALQSRDPAIAQAGRLGLLLIERGKEQCAAPIDMETAALPGAELGIDLESIVAVCSNPNISVAREILQSVQRAASVDMVSSRLV